MFAVVARKLQMVVMLSEVVVQLNGRMVLRCREWYMVLELQLGNGSAKW